MGDGATLACPVCGAGFRRRRRCPRCGADLFPLMYLAARSYLCRRGARRALQAGDARKARDLAVGAQELLDTRPGRRLVFLAALLSTRRAAVPRPGSSLTQPPPAP